MNGSLLDIFVGKDRAHFRNLNELLLQKRYDELLNYCNEKQYGFKNVKYYEMMKKEIKEEALTNPIFLMTLNNKLDEPLEYNEYAVSKNPSIIEYFINDNRFFSNSLFIKAIKLGYMPSVDYVLKHISYFDNSEILNELLKNGFVPNVELIEKLSSIFKDNELLLRVLKQGYVPKIEIIESKNLLSDPLLCDILFDVIPINEKTINSSMFIDNLYAQRKIINEHKELLLSLSTYNPSFYPFWLEAFRMGYIPNEILDNLLITSNAKLMARVIKTKPELIKYNTIIEKEESDELDKLAICMGYVPTIDDAKNNKHVRNSNVLMNELIRRRPEAIKYIDKDNVTFISQNEYYSLARRALEMGYTPSLKDLEDNPRLGESFDIMKKLIFQDSNTFKKIRYATPNKEELLKIAIENGYDEYLYFDNEDENDLIRNSLIATETYMKYACEKGRLPKIDKVYFKSNYSMELFNYFLKKGIDIDKVIDLFSQNKEVMAYLINENPNYINKVDEGMSRNDIDELALLAIEKGYIPKEEDEIFGNGDKVAIMMIKKYPNYINKVKLFDNIGIFKSVPCSSYDEMCRTALENGYIPNVESMEVSTGDLSYSKFQWSYDILKIAIPKKPILIEMCNVEEKELFDELCDLAISSGYIPNSEYALTHWATRLCTNKSIMKLYLKDNPNFISNVDIKDEKDFVEIIDFLVENKFDINSLNNDTILKLFVSFDEKIWNKYLNKDKVEMLKNAGKLYQNNDEISKTVNPHFLSLNSIKNLSKSQVEILSCYPNIQEKIIKLNKGTTTEKIVFEITKKYENNLEWITILEKVLDNITNLEFVNLLNEIDKKELTSLQKSNLMYLLMTDNHLDISTIEDLDNMDKIREEYIKSLIDRNTIGSLKEAYFEKVFGIDSIKAMELVQKYGQSLEENTIAFLDEKDRNTFTILNNMKKILNINNIEILKYYIDNVNPNIAIKPDLMVTYEAELKYLFTNEFNKSFVKPNIEDKVFLEGEDKDLDIYLAAGKNGNKKFRMMITSIGAYSNMEEPDDYYASWNVDKISSHGCCCSYVGEKNLGTAEVKYCCLGFTDYEKGALHISAPYDLCSSSKTDSYEIESQYEAQYLLPEDILDYTRHTHNETVWERRNISSDGLFKKQPSYIVYFVDNFDDRLTNNEAKRQWEAVKKASNDFKKDGKPLPIMVVEREKIAQNQLKIISKELDEFSKNLDKNLIKDIVTRYEDNYAGNREYHQNISLKYFPKSDELSTSVIGKIIEIIEKNINIDYEKSKECLLELEKVIKMEEIKYSNMEHGTLHSLPSFDIQESLTRINNIKEEIKLNEDSILVVLLRSGDNSRQFNKTDKKYLEDSVIESQISSEQMINLLSRKGVLSRFIQIENEVKKEKINSELKVHGKRHVIDVLLFSSFIGALSNESKEDILLLMEASKYHDIGRKNDANEEHAVSSSVIAREKLSDKMDPDSVNIICTMIEFHEVPRNNYNIDEVFRNIAIKNGVREEDISKARRLAEILKDADALDRTRFINRARLNPDYLFNPESKKMIFISSSLQETYALDDLKKYSCDEDIIELLKNYTPQEVIRTIRHSTRGLNKEEDIASFIKIWAKIEMGENKNDEDNKRKR